MNVPHIPIIGRSKTRIVLEMDNATNHLEIVSDPSPIDYARAVLMLSGAINMYTQNVMKAMGQAAVEAEKIAAGLRNGAAS